MTLAQTWLLAHVFFAATFGFCRVKYWIQLWSLTSGPAGFGVALHTSHFSKINHKEKNQPLIHETDNVPEKLIYRKKTEKNNFTRTDARRPGLPQLFPEKKTFLWNCLRNSCVWGLPGHRHLFTALHSRQIFSPAHNSPLVGIFDNIWQKPSDVHFTSNSKCQLKVSPEEVRQNLVKAKKSDIEACSVVLLLGSGRNHVTIDFSGHDAWLFHMLLTR